MHKILLIDDDMAMLDCLRMSLNSLGEYSVSTCEDALEGIERLKNHSFSVVITDVNMPRMSGLELLKWMNDFDTKIPVILITGESDSDIMLAAIHLGVYEFLKKPFAMNDLIITVKQAVQKHELLTQNELYQNNLESLVSLRTKELNGANQKLEQSYLNTIRAMVNAMEVNDVYMRGHSERVTAISVSLGQLMGLTKAELSILRIGAILHDLGKIGILSNVLQKAQGLTELEYTSIKQHPIIGAKIIDPIGLPPTVSQIILQHHEWYNGKGYPQGLDHSQINPLASIVSVADSFDAMTSQRPYRENLDFSRAIQEVHQNRSIQFDPLVAEILVKHQTQVFEVLHNIPQAQDPLTEDLR